MFRTTASRVVSKKVAQSGLSSTANAGNTMHIPPVTNICTSLIDGPLFLPGYDFLGKPLDEEPTAKPTTVVLESSKDVETNAVKSTDAQVVVKSEQAVTTVSVPKSSWLSSVIQLQHGTNAYHIINVTAEHALAKPSFIQRSLYGTADYILDGATPVKVVKEVKNIKVAEDKSGLIHRILHGIPEDVLDAGVSTKTTVAVVKKVEGGNVNEKENAKVVAATITKVEVADIKKE